MQFHPSFSVRARKSKQKDGNSLPIRIYMCICRRPSRLLTQGKKSYQKIIREDCRCEEENEESVHKVGGAWIEHEEEMQWEAAFSLLSSAKRCGRNGLHRKKIDQALVQEHHIYISWTGVNPQTNQNKTSTLYFVFKCVSYKCKLIDSGSVLVSCNAWCLLWDDIQRSNLFPLSKKMCYDIKC